MTNKNTVTLRPLIPALIGFATGTSLGAIGAKKNDKKLLGLGEIIIGASALGLFGYYAISLITKGLELIRK